MEWYYKDMLFLSCDITIFVVEFRADRTNGSFTVRKEELHVGI